MLTCKASTSQIPTHEVLTRPASKPRSAIGDCCLCAGLPRQPHPSASSKPSPPGHARHAAAEVRHQRALPCAQPAVEDGSAAGLEQQQPEVNVRGVHGRYNGWETTTGETQEVWRCKTASSCLGRTSEGHQEHGPTRCSLLICCLLAIARIWHSLVESVHDLPVGLVDGAHHGAAGGHGVAHGAHHHAGGAGVQAWTDTEVRGGRQSMSLGC